jgi:hypothetical protein
MCQSQRAKFGWYSRGLVDGAQPFGILCSAVNLGSCTDGAQQRCSLRSSFRDAPLGAGPESITTGRRCFEERSDRPFKTIAACGYGFRALASFAPE